MLFWQSEQNTKGKMKMELNYFKEILFDLVNESDKLAVLDIEEDYNNNTNNCSKVITEKSRPQGTALIIPPAQAAI